MAGGRQEACGRDESAIRLQLVRQPDRSGGIAPLEPIEGKSSC
jgi:hypothetical protein